MAEYTALPTSDKMNGSIYKITDKALIYCLDEEYHAVKEITSADYALLTSAEKNNGILYILTDEETTAADIPYSAGVSVADKLDAISFKKGTFTQSYSISANGTVNFAPSFINTPTGYSICAILGFATNKQNVVVAAINPTGGTWGIQLKNTSGTAETANFEITILFVKSELLTAI